MYLDAKAVCYVKSQYTLVTEYESLAAATNRTLWIKCISYNSASFKQNNDLDSLITSDNVSWWWCWQQGAQSFPTLIFHSFPWQKNGNSRRMEQHWLRTWNFLYCVRPWIHAIYTACTTAWCTVNTDLIISMFIQNCSVQL